MPSRIRAGTILQIVDLLRCAADHAHKSPYPMVEAAERLGIGLDDLCLIEAKHWRDVVKAEIGGPLKWILLEAAQRLADTLTKRRPRAR